MLQPKKTKYRKQQKGKLRGFATYGAKVSFGEFGLKATTRGRVTARQIEAARRAMTRHIKRGGKVWIRIFPDVPITKKHIWAAHLNLANVTIGKRFTIIRIGDFHVHTRKRHANRAGATFAIIGVGCVHIGFGHAIALENTVPCPAFKLNMGFSQQRRTSRNEKPHMTR